MRRNPNIERETRERAELQAKRLAFEFSQVADQYSKAIIGFLIEYKIVEPAIGRIQVLNDGQVAVVLTNSEHMIFGTFDSMMTWLNWVAEKSGMNQLERTAWIKLADQKITLDIEFQKKLSRALPAPQVSSEGAPMYDGEPVNSVQEYIGVSTVDDIVDSQGEEGILYLALDVSTQYPLDWSFEKVRYQPGQFEIHDFKDWTGDERLSFIRILKSGPRKPGEAEADSILTSGKPGDKNEQFVSHALRYDEDKLGNQFVWFYNVPIFLDEWYSETFDEEYLSRLQSMVPDPNIQNRLILEYDINYVNPGSYDAEGIGWLGIVLAALMLDGRTGIYRPDPSIVFERPGKVTPNQIFESVCKFNNLTFDDRLTQFSPGFLFSSYYRWEDINSLRRNKPKRKR